MESIRNEISDTVLNVHFDEDDSSIWWKFMLAYLL